MRTCTQARLHAQLMPADRDSHRWRKKIISTASLRAVFVWGMADIIESCCWKQFLSKCRNLCCFSVSNTRNCWQWNALVLFRSQTLTTTLPPPHTHTPTFPSAIILSPPSPLPVIASELVGVEVACLFSGLESLAELQSARIDAHIDTLTATIQVGRGG
jgi:hypothetical protein